MQEFLNLINEGFDLHDIPFVRRLMIGHNQHKGRNIKNVALQRFSRTHQMPPYLVFSDDQTPIPAIFHMPPGSVFLGSCAGGVIDAPFAIAPGAANDDLPPRTAQAVAHYGVGVLGASNVLVVTGTKSPILQYLMGRKKLTGPFMDIWESSVWRPIRQNLEEDSAYTKSTWKHKARLTAVVLAQLNARRMQASLEWLGTKAEFKVIPAVFDDNRRLITYTRRDDSDQYVEGHTVNNISIPRNHKGQRRALGCSCCDSRASHTHLYCTEPGEFRENYSIAGILPDYREVLATKAPNSSWLQIEMAEAEGCTNYVTTGHTKCGGIHALVKWVQKGTAPSDPYLAAWLRQAEPAVSQVVRFAEQNGFAKDEERVCRLAEMYVTQWSATNMKRYLMRDGRPYPESRSQVLANYLDIESREVYPLPLLNAADSPEQSIAKTYQLVEKLYNKSDPDLPQLMTLSDMDEICAKVKRAEMHDSLRAIFDCVGDSPK